MCHTFPLILLSFVRNNWAEELVKIDAMVPCS